MDEILTELRKQTEILERIDTRTREKMPSWSECQGSGKFILDLMKRSKGDDGVSLYDRVFSGSSEIEQIQEA